MQHFYIFSRQQNEVNSPCLEQSQTIHQSEHHASSRLRSALLANGVVLEIEGCRGKEPLQSIWLSFLVVAVVAPFWRGGLKQFICLRGELGGLQGVIGVVGERGGRKGGRLDANASRASIRIQTHHADSRSHISPNVTRSRRFLLKTRPCRFLSINNRRKKHGIVAEGSFTT